MFIHCSQKNSGLAQIKNCVFNLNIIQVNHLYDFRKRKNCKFYKKS